MVQERVALHLGQHVAEAGIDDREVQVARYDPEQRGEKSRQDADAEGPRNPLFLFRVECIRFLAHREGKTPAENRHDQRGAGPLHGREALGSGMHPGEEETQIHRRVCDRDARAVDQGCLQGGIGVARSR